MPDALNAINLRNTPQSQPADPRQVQNSAGGYAFTVAPVERLRRFLVLGIDGGTYYATERQLTKANAEVVLAWARDRTSELVDEVVSISTSGRPRGTTRLCSRWRLPQRWATPKAVRLLWQPCRRSPGRVLTCFYSPGTSSSSVAGGVVFVVPWPIGTCPSPLMRSRTRR